MLQIVGVGCSSSLSDNELATPPSQYGYEVLMGLGFGLGLSTLLVLVPLVVNASDMGKYLTPLSVCLYLTSMQLWQWEL